ncbi:MAG: hypothetical protein AB1861_14465 [Cyanobacteriota bacterium]
MKMRCNGSRIRRSELVANRFNGAALLTQGGLLTAAIAFKV